MTHAHPQPGRTAPRRHAALFDTLSLSGHALIVLVIVPVLKYLIAQVV